MRVRQVVRVVEFVIAGTIAFELLRGAVTLGISWTGGLMTRRAEQAERREAARPPRAYPIRPGDYARFPRQEFDFAWSDEHGNGLDTFRGIASKDLGHLDTTIVLALTEAEKDSVYEAVIRMRLLDPDTPFVPHPNGCFAVPATRNALRVVAGPHQRRIEWRWGCEPTGGGSGDFKRIRDLWHVIHRQLMAHPEYRSLPESEGVYL